MEEATAETQEGSRKENETRSKNPTPLIKAPSRQVIGGWNSYLARRIGQSITTHKKSTTKQQPNNNQHHFKTDQARRESKRATRACDLPNSDMSNRNSEKATPHTIVWARRSRRRAQDSTFKRISRQAKRKRTSWKYPRRGGTTFFSRRQTPAEQDSKANGGDRKCRVRTSDAGVLVSTPRYVKRNMRQRQTHRVFTWATSSAPRGAPCVDSRPCNDL